MPKPRLSAMSIEALIDLRRQIDETLAKHRAEIETELKRMDGVVGGARGGSTLKGRKIPPRYRSPSGETWAGRGARPRWLVAAVKGGKKLDDYLIEKAARKRSIKRRSKR